MVNKTNVLEIELNGTQSSCKFLDVKGFGKFIHPLFDGIDGYMSLTGRGGYVGVFPESAVVQSHICIYVDVYIYIYIYI